ncbi:DUF58 domain-containing protein [Proteiniclasticum sp. BAD-10]|uniref:DUF58 domain-containing protein n=1 Tax=Proteiniclasticum sediminis TaxID=2804028 RepID=A0A941HQM5_9CLOT|nr:DUF58 domain-containing protein [Proteiniclasticum sediminis]MBR0576160.1 DUF58 domain-containing protein [Proteiniclasticum sediminis]
MRIDFKFLGGFLGIILLYYAVGGVVFTSLYFIFLCIFVLAVMSVFFFLRKVSGKITPVRPEYEVFDTARILIQIYNDSRFFLPHVTAIMNRDEMETRSIGPRRKIQLAYNAYLTHRGIYEFDHMNLEIRDIFNIFTLTKLLHKQSIRVYPKIKDMSHYAFELGVGSAGISASRSPQKDPYNTRELRRYAPGDSLKRINWKVSAKQGELYVRVGEQTKGMDFLLVIDMNESIYRLDPDGLKEEALISTALGVSKMLIAAGKDHKVIINALERKEVEIRRMANFNALVEYMVEHNSVGRKPLHEFMNEKTEIFKGAASIIIFSSDRGPDLRHVVEKVKDKYNHITWFSCIGRGGQEELEGITLLEIEDI